MNLETNRNNIDFTKNPYRGTFTAVAKILSKRKNKKMSNDAVHKLFKRREPEVTELVINEVERRESIAKKADKILNKSPILE